MVIKFFFKDPHLEAAKGAIAYVEKTIVHSSNFANRNKVLVHNSRDKKTKIVDYSLFKKK